MWVGIDFDNSLDLSDIVLVFGIFGSTGKKPHQNVVYLLTVILRPVSIFLIGLR